MKYYYLTDDTIQHNSLLWIITTGRGKEVCRYMPNTYTETHIRHIQKTVVPNPVLIALNPYRLYTVKVKSKCQEDGYNTVVYPTFYAKEKAYEGLKKTCKAVNIKIPKKPY